MSEYIPDSDLGIPRRLGHVVNSGGPNSPAFHMAATPAERYDCSHPDCTTGFVKAEAVDGSYCSAWCSNHHEGLKILKNVKHDHRYCFACFRKIKEVNPARPKDPDCFIGYQFVTQHGELGEKVFDADREANPTHVVGDKIYSGVICTCGTTDHRDDYFRNLDLREAVERFLDVYRAMYEEGQHEKYLDARVLVAELAEDPSDWAHAVGKAIAVANTADAQAERLASHR